MTIAAAGLIVWLIVWLIIAILCCFVIGAFLAVGSTALRGLFALPRLFIDLARDIRSDWKYLRKKS